MYRHTLTGFEEMFSGSFLPVICKFSETFFIIVNLHIGNRDISGILRDHGIDYLVTRTGVRHFDNIRCLCDTDRTVLLKCCLYGSFCRHRRFIRGVT